MNALLFIAGAQVLVLANNRGLPADAPLAYAEADASQVAATFQELGVPTTRLPQAKPASAVEALRALPAAELAVVFVSGHGDSRGVHLGGELLEWATLRQALEAVDARVVVTFIDACQSGSVFKGLVRGPPLALTLTRSGPKGHALITSSGADELSTESLLLGGSPFAHALISALRGAADSDGNGNVTIGETYAFLVARTLAHTLAARSGPQHVGASIQLKGEGEVTLSQPAGVTLRRAADATDVCYVLDDNEAAVLAELAPGQSARLPRRALVVKCLAGDRLRVARIDTPADAVIDSLAFEQRPRLFALVKGADEQPLRGLSLTGGVWLSAGERARPALTLRYRGGDHGFGWHLLLMTDPRFGQGSQTLGAAGIGYILPWARTLDIELGLQGGGGVSERASPQGLLALGQFASFNWWWLDARVDILELFLLGPQAAAVFSVVFSLGVRLTL